MKHFYACARVVPSEESMPMKQSQTALQLLKPLGLLVFLLSALGARAQQRAVPSLFREDAAARQAAVVSPLATALRSSRPLTLDAPSLQATLAAAPLEGQTNATPVVLALPLPDGTSGRFRVVESPVMEPGLAAQFPSIKTYSGVGVDDPTASVRLDLTPRGFHAQILSDVSGTVYIDPVTRTDTQHYLSFARSAMPAAQLNCGVSANTRRNLGSGPQTAQRTSGPTLRTYRLAVAATGEYTTFQGGTVALAQAAIVTTVNRVRGVYEKELAVSLTLVANNSLLVYTNPATDPYTNADPDALLNENQANINSVIGSGNYDIGHVFSTAGGGLASLGVVCRAGNKAQGETGTSSPVGDAFDIDYVAHEMGHQFGANHTFNGIGGSCDGNRNTGTAYEPGSGTTIMAYAGICGAANNTQSNSDAYFHVASYEEIQAYLATTSCGTSTATGNTPPTVTLPASSKVLPISTPFKLTAVGSDANGDALTYCWEEYDLGLGGSPTVTQVAGDDVPLFRSFSPSSSSTRYFPRLADVIANTTTLGERLPTVTRSLNFRVTLRDRYTTNNTGTGAVGGVNSSTVVALSSVSTAGPFIVTAPNTAVTWAGNSSQTVTWNVAKTSAAPVSCATVNLRLSTDGGLTYPTLLLAGTPNDGSATITVPSTATTTARVMVEAADNYFFDISNTNFTITVGAACAAPTGLTVSNITSTSSAVSFTASGSATSYTVTTSPATTTQTVTGSPVSFIGLTPGTAYTVSILSNCAGGATAGPATVSFSTAAPAPAITSLTPNSGPIGTGVTIVGTNLTGATTVSFNGTAASFTVNSATSITATVPTGASTGNVTVTTGGGTSNGLTFTVTTPAANTTTTLSSSLNPSSFGQSVTLTATVSSGNGTPGGTVAFFDGATSLGNGSLNAGGIAMLSISTLAVGSHSLTVVYNGASGFNGSTSAALTQVVNLAATTTVLTSSPNPSTFGQAVALTATVSNANGTPTGSVSYYDGSTLLGNATLSSGAATLNVSTLAVGSHSVTAIYSGSSSFATSTSAAIIQVVNVAAPTITSLSPTSGLVGSSVIITGTNLTGATAVSFNGTAATVFTVNSATSITATVPAGATTGNVTVTTAGGTSNGITFTVITPTTTSWLGGGTTNWFTATNWSAGVPTSTLDATVPVGASPYPVIASGTASAKSLTIGSSASLTQNGGTLVVPGNIANSGTISATAGLVSLSGTTAQAIGGSGSTQFWSLAIINPAGASQTGAVSIHGILALSSGNLTTNGQLLTLLSDAAGTALVDNTGGVVNGTATVQCYIDPSLNAGPGYRHYSAPVNITTVADFSTSGFTPTVNSAYNTSATPGLITPFPTVFGYDESRVLSSPATTYSAFDKGWVSPGGLGDALQVGRGYTVNIPATQKVDFVGNLNNGPVSRGLARSSADGGLHLIGNPYPSPLDWSRVSIPAGLDNALYVFQSTSQYGGSYRSYVNGVGNPVVALGQGFFVRMNTGATSATLTMTNAARETTSSATTFNRGTETRPLVQLTLRGSNTRLTDEAYVYFEAGATTGIDAGYDARKIQHNTGGAPTIFALAAGTELSINGLPQLAATTVVPLGVEMPQAGTYTFEAAQLLNLSAANVYLHDALTGQDIDLHQQPTYSFSVNSAALLTGRFSLTFEQARVLASAQGLAAASVSVYPNPATGSFTVLVPAVAGAKQVEATLFNSLGQRVGQHTAALPATGTQLLFDAKGLASGIYMLRVKAGDAFVTKRVTIK